MSNRQQFLAGIKAQLPILLGVAPFGMIYGIAAIDAGLGPIQALGMSMIVFAGSAQFVAAQLFSANALGIVIVLTTFVVNLRHMLYSASVAPYVRHLKRPWKYVLAFLLTDEAYAVTIINYRTASPEATRTTNKHWFMLGAELTLWVTWQISTIVGVVLGASVPASWGLDFTLALTFIALLIPTLEDAPAIAAALAAGIVATAANSLPYNLGLLLGVVIGIGVGLGAERLAGRRVLAAALPGGDD
jgi:4-azaleucine resistance transporter AzlC